MRFYKYRFPVIEYIENSMSWQINIQFDVFVWNVKLLHVTNSMELEYVADIWRV